MKTVVGVAPFLSTGLLAVCFPLAAADARQVGREMLLNFSSASQENFEGKTKVKIGNGESADDLVVVCTSTSKCETAWRIWSDAMRLPSRTGGYVLDFEVFADDDWICRPRMGGAGDRCEAHDNWSTKIIWYGPDGGRLVETPVFYEFFKGKYAHFRFCGTVPAKAVSVVLQFGVDDPNLRPGERVAFRKISLSAVPEGKPLPENISVDVMPPRIDGLFDCPANDPNLVLRYRITDTSGVDWPTLSVTEPESKEKIPFERSGDVVTLKPGRPWKIGLNAIFLSVMDTKGNAVTARRAFLIGDRPTTTVTSLRDDGVTLIGRKPFFPIGIFGVGKHEFNNNDLDQAVKGLKDAGFNLVHSYTDGRNAEFLSAARKYGMYVWTDAKHCFWGDKWLVETGRHDPCILSWYIGDDTSYKTWPWELLDRYESARMQDGSRLISQADWNDSAKYKSRYRDYVDYSDVYMPEIYPIYGRSEAEDKACVAVTVRDMETALADIAACPVRRPHGIWPILQIFHGGKTLAWSRYPTKEEFYAISFAALIHGGNGILWFHYAGEEDPAKNRTYSGAFRTPETWGWMTNLSSRISALSPVFLERKPSQPTLPEVLKGPENDPLGQPAVSVLVKNHAGFAYVFAVNASPEPVRARLHVTCPDGEGAVAWEKRAVSVSHGSFEDEFAGFGVHVYRFSLKE